MRGRRMLSEQTDIVGSSMIAVCPTCRTRYRVPREKLGAAGVRVRCRRCESTFRVQAPPAAPANDAHSEARTGEAQPSNARGQSAQNGAGNLAARTGGVQRGTEVPLQGAAPAAAGASVLLALSDAARARDLQALLATAGLAVIRCEDGVEAVLEIQRRLPAAVVVSFALPKMSGVQICELLKRNPSLRSLSVVLVHEGTEASGALDFQGFGPDAVVSLTRGPSALVAALRAAGLPLTQAPIVGEDVARKRSETRPEPLKAIVSEAVLEEAPALAAQRAQAERLARIAVSDIVLYNERKFEAAVKAGNVLTALAGELEEGRELLRRRIDERVCSEKDYLAEELLRVAQARAKNAC